MINITPSANLQISKLCEENQCYAISLNLKGGGCAGFEYQWSTVQKEDIESNDFVVGCVNGNLVIGSHSLIFLAGTEIDYVKTLVGSNFEIRNPNAKSSCGCGVSVNFDYDKLIKSNDGVL
jgi:iron-sulfur cluster assembly protein